MCGVNKFVHTVCKARFHSSLQANQTLGTSAVMSSARDATRVAMAVMAASLTSYSVTVGTVLTGIKCNAVS